MEHPGDERVAGEGIVRGIRLVGLMHQGRGGKMNERNVVVDDS